MRDHEKMPTTPPGSTTEQLQHIAHDLMQSRGFLPDFSPEVMAEARSLAAAPMPIGGDTVRDLRGLPWASIDNDDSMDLDQLSVSEALPDGATRCSSPSPTWTRW